MKDIVALEQVQRRFTKRVPGMSALTYHQRLVTGQASLWKFRVTLDALV